MLCSMQINNLDHAIATSPIAVEWPDDLINPTYPVHAKK